MERGIGTTPLGDPKLPVSHMMRLHAMSLLAVWSWHTLLDQDWAYSVWIVEVEGRFTLSNALATNEHVGYRCLACQLEQC